MGDREEFDTQGYTLKRALFGEHDVTEMRGAMDHLRANGEAYLRLFPEFNVSERKIPHEGSELVIARTDGTDQVKRVLWAGAAEPTLLRYGRDPRLTEIVAGLLENETADHLINQVHFKLPNDGVDDYDWHQDATHRRYGTDEWTDVNGRGSYVQVLVAIEENAMDNGPLLVIPGKYGFLGKLDNHQLPSGFDEGMAIPVLLKPGDALFFGPYLLHKSEPNTSERSRYVLINGFASPGANRRSYPGHAAGAGENIRLR